MSTTLSEISDLFKLAEKKIKFVENLDEGLLFPAVNQLRYVAFHLLRESEAQDISLKQEELRKAKNHCQRAIYDSVETGITFCLVKIHEFQEDYKLIVVADVVPAYIDIC